MVGLLTREYFNTDKFLSNATTLCLDVLAGWSVTAKWISRDENTICDALARKAVADREVRVVYPSNLNTPIVVLAT